MEHQAADVDQPPAARAFDLGTILDERGVICFLESWDACHEFPQMVVAAAF